MAFSTLTGLASRYSIVVDSDEWPDEQGRALVQKSALLLAAQGHAGATAPARAQLPAWVQPPSIGAAAVQGELDAVRRHLASVETERDRALAERDRALGEVKRRPAPRCARIEHACKRSKKSSTVACAAC
jgi:hypothetical protein